jgi:uncharacterized protein
MALDQAALTLVVITLFAATVNGALGYGFSSLTVPVALLFYTNRVLNPALVLVEVVLNSYVLFINRASIPRVWRRVLPIILGLIPGIVIGSLVLSLVDPGITKVITYVIILPLILFQAAGFRRYIQAERAIGVPFGTSLGVLYSVTTISGPPLALLFNNQGFVRQDFRAGLAIVRIVESSVTAIAYFFLGLYSLQSVELLPYIVPSVVIGIPVGAFLIRHIEPEVFRRICMSFDAWVVGFGLSRNLMDLKIVGDPAGYLVLAAAATIDCLLLYRFFSQRRALQGGQAERAVASPALAGAASGTEHGP